MFRVPVFVLLLLLALSCAGFAVRQGLRIPRQWEAASRFHAGSDFVVLVDSGPGDRDGKPYRIYAYEWEKSLREFRAETPVTLGSTGSARIGPDPGVEESPAGLSPTGWIAVPLELPDSVAAVYRGLCGRSVVVDIALGIAAAVVFFGLVLGGRRVHRALVARLEALAAWGRERERWKPAADSAK